MVKCMLTSDTHYGMDGKTHNKHLKFWKKVAKTIEEENVQVLIWAGDISSNRQRHVKQSMEMARKHVKIPIALVRGNHCLWQGEDPKCKERKKGPMSLDRIFQLHKEWFTEYNIHHLEKGPLVIDDVIICGFDGWYAEVDPGTNDKNWIPRTINGQPFVMQYLVTKAWKDMQACMDIDTSGYRKSICVTHHNPYPFSPHTDYTDKPTDKFLEEGITSMGYSASFKFLPEIRSKFDVLCCGHTHGYKNDTVEGIQIYNSGSDYNDPKFLIFDI